MPELNKEDAERWPGVEHAFAFVIPSYQWMLSRIEAADSRLQTMQVLVLTVTTAIPAFAKAVLPSVTLWSPLLAGVSILAATSIVVGTIARSATRIVLLDPALLCHKDWLRLSGWSFKYNALHFAGKHFATNSALVTRKYHALVLMTGLFLAELLLLAAWWWSAARI